MPNKMLIDATHPEETRVVVVRGNRVEEFDFETAQRKQLRGNIYLAKVTRVEPSLQAAFVEYGGNRHGFLAFSEIHPDYYQIPVADRQALIEAEERAHREAEEESENRSNRRRNRHRSSRRRGSGERVQSEIIEAADASQAPHGETHEGDHGAFEAPDAAYAQDNHPADDAGAETPAQTAGFAEAPLEAPTHAAHDEGTHDAQPHHGSDAPAVADSEPAQGGTDLPVSPSAVAAAASSGEVASSEADDAAEAHDHDHHDHDHDHDEDDHHDDDHHED
ncbi:MAG: S1 RNA-binding domain-containing protein, partial [Bradyrhizobium sp.]|nr:S1 RNA-binding domain-containing protein [Bradyrhizobium sp.]